MVDYTIHMSMQIRYEHVKTPQAAIIGPLLISSHLLISHQCMYALEVFPGILGGGVRPAAGNPYPI